MGNNLYIRDNTKFIGSKEDGEILQDFVIEKKCNTQEEFLKIYINSIDDLASIDHLTFQVMLIVLKRARFCDKENKDGNEFFNNDNFKKEVKDKLGLKKDNTVNKYVSNLAKAKILLRVNKGSYILNPRYFARGKMTDKTRMELIVKYDG
jgi:hypothetical protein